MLDLKDVFLDLKKFIRARGKYWLIPILIFFFVVGFLLLFSAPLTVAPLIYSLF